MAARSLPASSFWEAFDQISANLERESQTAQRDLAALEHIIARGWTLSPDPGETQLPTPPGRKREGAAGDDRSPAAPDPAPVVLMPRRTTHGGPFGPRVEARITALALEKRKW